MNNDGMNRPSLLSGTPAAGKSPVSSSRILADMEGRAPERAAPARIRVRHRAWRLPLLVTLLALAAVAMLAIGRWHQDAGDAPDRTSLGAAPPIAAPTLATESSPAPGGAMIVDEAAPEAISPAQTDTPLATPAATATATADAPGSAPPLLARTEPATGAAQRVPVTPGQRRKTGKQSDDDLLGTLIGIIKQKPNEQKPESMDALIAQIQADQNRNNAALDRIDQSASTQSGVQARLRRCPPANTTQGMECRRKVCASVSGKDPACPAR